MTASGSAKISANAKLREVGRNYVADRRVFRWKVYVSRPF